VWAGKKSAGLRPFFQTSCVGAGKKSERGKVKSFGVWEVLKKKGRIWEKVSLRPVASRRYSLAILDSSGPNEKVTSL